MSNVKEMYERLWNYEYVSNCEKTSPIVIVAPDCTKRNKLRMYADGGIIGRISVGKGKSELLDIAYDGHLLIHGKIKDYVENAKKMNNEEINKIIMEDDYLKLAIDAIEGKFNKKSKDTKKERNIETRIIKKYMHSNVNWSVIDMEVQLSKKVFNNAEFEKGTTKSPRFDLIFLSEKGFGIIELKCYNENCDNIKSHYEHMTYVLNNPDEFEREFRRRIECLIKYDLVSTNTEMMYRRLKEVGKIPIWCGFIFVEGGKNVSQSKIKVLDDKKEIDKIKFMYCTEADLNKLDIDKMQSYKEFMNCEAL